MKKTLFLFLSLGIIFSIRAQENTTRYHTENVLRINFLNPGLEYEYGLSENTTLSVGIGVGYGASYPDLDESNGTGFVYLISPFLDIQYKCFYNFEKRLANNKNTTHNSGNFISGRFYTRGEAIESNFKRTSDYDFAVGPTWGIQRNYGRFHLLFDVGTIYYFDTEGNGNWFPIMLQLNLGFNL